MRFDYAGVLQPVGHQARAEKPQGMEMAEEVDKLKGVYANPETSQFTVEAKEGSNDIEPFMVR